MSEKKVVGRNVVIALGIIIIILLVGLAGAVTNYTSIIASKDSEITRKNSQISSLTSQKDNLQNQVNALNGSYQRLLTKHIELNNSYNSLSQTYQILLINYTELDQEHHQLMANYTHLLNEYNALIIEYASLMEDYEKLLKAFNEPLPYRLTPTINELDYWLRYEDNADKIAYNYMNFVCGDFAVMLSLHAKLKYWDMTVVIIFGHNQTGHRFDHIFNAIKCEEGLVYIEPQTDTIFWYRNHEKITEGAWYRFPDFPEHGYIYVEEYIEVLPYD